MLSVTSYLMGPSQTFTRRPGDGIIQYNYVTGLNAVFQVLYLTGVFFSLLLLHKEPEICLKRQRPARRNLIVNYVFNVLAL